MNLSELSAEQKYALRKFINGENLFITGPGGTGKTHLIKHLVQHANSVNKHIDVCAMTGCAAILLKCNATTLHSWSGIKLARGSTKSIISSVLKNKTVVASWKKTKILVIDEVSMLSRKLFELLEELGRVIRKSSSPFGGIQIIFTGDFFQLPPIGKEDEPETGEFCFESSVWNIVFKRENMIELKKMFRQTDPLYINILQQARIGELNDENKRILQSYVNRKYDIEKNNGCVPTKLFALRSKADYINNMMFSKINEKEYVFEVVKSYNAVTYIDSGKAIDPELYKQCCQKSEIEKEYDIDQLINNSPCSKIFRYKKGTVVMCLVNLDMDQGICNGSQGIIIDILENHNESQVSIPIVKFSNGITKMIIPYVWQSENNPTITVSQYPLCMAWAITIHKIQGATLSMAEMDIGLSIFEYGQSYVALSRIKSLDGLYLTAFQSQKIMANPKVVEFYNSFPNIDTFIENELINEPDFTNFIYKENPDIKIIKL